MDQTKEIDIDLKKIFLMMRKKVVHVEAPSTRAASVMGTMSMACIALLIPEYTSGITSTKYAPASTSTMGRSVPP